MATGAFGHIGMGREALTGSSPNKTWGVGVVPTVTVPATFDGNATFPEIEVDVPTGSRNAPRSDRGRAEYAGSLGGIVVKPNTIGHIFQAALNDAVTTDEDDIATPPTFNHVWTPRANPISPDIALHPYSLQETKGSKTRRYTGGTCNEFTLSCDASERMTADSSWMFRDWTTSGLTAATPVIETNPSFMFRHAAHTKGGDAFNDIKNFSMTFTNNCEPDMAQDGSEALRAVYLGTARATFDLTVMFNNTDVFDDWLNYEDDAWTFKYVINDAFSLEIEVPNFSIKEHSDPLSGRDMLEVSLTAAAEDGGAGLFTITLINTQASYA